MLNRRPPLNLFVAIVWLLIFSGSFTVITYAQSATATLSGTVVDPNGAGVANASVTLTGANGVRQTATTDADGAFSFSSIASGVYTARVEVLRGPQGTLYGRNAIGGAVNFIYLLKQSGYENVRGEWLHKVNGFEAVRAFSTNAKPMLRFMVVAQV